MNKSSSSDDWLQAELADALDEDLELELSEPALSEEIRKIYKDSHPPTIDRAQYFQHLLTLQAELIKLQDWVHAHQGKDRYSLRRARCRRQRRSDQAHHAAA